MICPILSTTIGITGAQEGGSAFHHSQAALRGRIVHCEKDKCAWWGNDDKRCAIWKLAFSPITSGWCVDDSRTKTRQELNKVLEGITDYT